MPFVVDTDSVRCGSDGPHRKKDVLRRDLRQDERGIGGQLEGHIGIYGGRGRFERLHPLPTFVDIRQGRWNRAIRPVLQVSQLVRQRVGV